MFSIFISNTMETETVVTDLSKNRFSSKCVPTSVWIADYKSTVYHPYKWLRWKLEKKQNKNETFSVHRRDHNYNLTRFGSLRRHCRTCAFLCESEGWETAWPGLCVWPCWGGIKGLSGGSPFVTVSLWLGVAGGPWPTEGSPLTLASTSTNKSMHPPRHIQTHTNSNYGWSHEAGQDCVKKRDRLKRVNGITKVNMKG